MGSISMGGAGGESTSGGGVTFKSYSTRSRDLASGDNWMAGWYNAPAAAAELDTEGAGLTQTLGVANAAYAAHAFVVASGPGTTDGSDLVLTVSGTSITDAGVRAAGDSEVVVSTGTGSTVDQYFETVKKWIGQTTYSLTSTGGTVFNYYFNYGLAKYEDFGNRQFKLTDAEIVGMGTANDAAFDMTLYKHDSTGWTYSLAAFVPGGNVLGQLSVIHSTEREIKNNVPFAAKLADLNEIVSGSNSEGVVVKITTGTNKSVKVINLHLGVVI